MVDTILWQSRSAWKGYATAALAIHSRVAGTGTTCTSPIRRVGLVILRSRPLKYQGMCVERGRMHLLLDLDYKGACCRCAITTLVQGCSWTANCIQRARDRGGLGRKTRVYGVVSWGPSHCVTQAKRNGSSEVLLFSSANCITHSAYAYAGRSCVCSYPNLYLESCLAYQQVRGKHSSGPSL
jgi:hypothetical protein